MSDQDNKMREAFMIAFNQVYTPVIELLNKLPLAPLLKSHCFMNLDQGAYWAREAIMNMQFNSSVEEFTPPNDENIIDEPIKEAA